MHLGSILIVEDDKEIAELLTLYLTQNDYQVTVVDDWTAVNVLKTQPVDLILLDVMLPEANGFDLCRECRKYSDVPILFVSAKSEDADKILGLSLGADDFISKPFSPAEVVARVHAQLRRYRAMASKAGRSSPVFRVGDLQIDEENFTVTVRGETIPLSTKEFQILKLLSQNTDKVLMTDELYQNIWHSPIVGDVRTVMVHISNLRRKIELDPAHPKYIVTIRGMGYQFMASP